jgi:predicted dehydrogenase
MTMNSSAPLRGALIGCGFVSQYHLAAWRDQPEAALVALCDLDPQRLEQAAALAPGARQFRDAAEMLATMKLDFVEICTTPDSHVALVSMAARHGVHVLCQKPAARTRAELLAMIASCEEAGVRLMIHENWRFRPWYRALRAAVDDGTIGRPIRLRLVHRDTRGLRPDGFADQPYFTTMSQLILIEMGCHLIDTARYLLGEVQAVAATVRRFGEGHVGDDLAMLLLEFTSGAVGLLDLSWCGVPDLARPEWALNESAIEGTTGTLRVQVDGTLQLVGLDGRTRTESVAMPPPEQVYIDGYRATQAHFVAGLLHGLPHETSGRDTLKTMDVVWTAYRAAEEGRRLSVVDCPELGF